jgi:hypothetical protein
MASIITAFMSYSHGNQIRESSKSIAEFRQSQDALNEQRNLKEHEKSMMYEAIISGIMASLKASDVSLIALQGGHLNGNVEDARKDVGAAIERMEVTQRKAVVHLTEGAKK